MNRISISRVWASSALLLALTACATDGVKPTEPVVETQEVDKPVAQSCVPENTPDAPTQYSDNPAALRAAPDGPARALLVLKGREERSARLAVVEPVVAGCRKAGGK